MKHETQSDIHRQRILIWEEVAMWLKSTGYRDAAAHIERMLAQHRAPKLRVVRGTRSRK
jgi:hypothetical protein